MHAVHLAPTPPCFWADLKSPDFARLDLSRTIAVLPLGAVEQHGPHLPLKVDSALVDAVVQATLACWQPPASGAAAPATPAPCVLFLPTQAVGYSPEHSGFAGTLSLSAATVIRVWTELAESVAATGVKKLVLLNSHGGQVGLLDVVARDLRTRLGMLVYSVNSFNLPLKAADGSDVSAQFSAHEHRFGIHAGDIETSMMLALEPQRVDMTQAQNFHSTSQDRAAQFALLGDGRSAKLGWQMQDYNPHGAVGNAAAATATKGQAVLAAMGRSLAQLLAEIDQLPADILQPAQLTTGRK